VQNAIFDMSGKTAVVTGASSGLGVRFARVLADAGASLVLAARREAAVQQLAASLPDAVGVRCDVTSEQDCAELVQVALQRSGRIDVLVNNAGVSHVAKAEVETTDTFRGVVDVNLVATYTLSRLVGIEMLREGSGCIVNVASMVGLVGLGRMPQASYAASKAGVINLTRELAAQWARRGVRVNAIAPGFFPSEMTQELFGTDSGQAWVEKMTPMGRGGRDGELDGALLLLASEAGSYMTGSVITVDGGWTAV
jgi:NAD(P)-dependent dehydrogenase (short-subunit alcohol dehydrogenase family)